jgi:AraC-like DNA-binding protein
MQANVPESLDPSADNEDLRALRDAVDRRTVGEKAVATKIERLSFARAETSTLPLVCFYDPKVFLILQGRKRVVQGGDPYVYGAGYALLASVDLPATAQIIEGSPERPYLSLSLGLDQAAVVQLLAETPYSSKATGTPNRGIAVTEASPKLLSAFRRLVELLDEPEALPLLAPLAEREVLFRLLTSELGERLRQVASVGTQGNGIARAIAFLKTHYREPLRIEDLAAGAGMSESTFHRHFRAVTAVTPLQFQKLLRLDEARTLMLNEGLDAASAAFHVGYESPSQFSREFRRTFGAPPARHISAILQAP